MKRAAVTCIAVAGAFVLAGLVYPNFASRQHSYRRPASAFAGWAL